jgi:hypothetical protein
MVRKPHTLKCRAVPVTETKLACIRPASFFNVLLDYFQNNFLQYFAVVDKKLIDRKFLGNLGSLPGFSNVTTFASFQDFGKWDSPK